MLFADLSITHACPKHVFLEEMDKTIPWDLFQQKIKPAIHHKKGGRPAFSRLLLFQIHLLKTWFGLSDTEVEFQIHDRLSFRKFLKLTIDDTIPDSTTIENFRHEMLKTALLLQFMDMLDGYFKDKEIVLKKGNMVDATFIKANSRPRKDIEKQSDKDADHGHKGFGYSATINVDQDTKLIRNIIITSSERPHDSQHLEAVLTGDENIIYADSGYVGKEAVLKDRNVKARIIKKRAQ